MRYYVSCILVCLIHLLHLTSPRNMSIFVIGALSCAWEDPNRWLETRAERCDVTFWNKLSLVIKLLQVSSSTLSVLTSRISWCVNFGLEELLLELVDCLDVHLAEFLQSGRVKGKRRRCGVEGLTNKVFSRPFESQWKFESFRNWSRADGLGSIVHDHACMQRMCNACVCVVLFIHCKKKFYYWTIIYSFGNTSIG